MNTPLDNDLKKVYEAFNQKHDQLRESLMASLPRPSKQHKQRSKFAHIGALIGDTIMKNKITKLAAVAVIIIAVLIGISHFGGSIDGASQVFAHMLEEMQGIPWVHAIMEDDQSKGLGESWVSFEPSIVILK